MPLQNTKPTHRINKTSTQSWCTMRIRNNFNTSSYFAQLNAYSSSELCNVANEQFVGMADMRRNCINIDRWQLEAWLLPTWAPVRMSNTIYGILDNKQLVSQMFVLEMLRVVATDFEWIAYSYCYLVFTEDFLTMKVWNVFFYCVGPKQYLKQHFLKLKSTVLVKIFIARANKALNYYIII